LQISENLKDKEQYVHTDEYLEEMARKLGLLYPDEVIFKPED
jgi:cell division protein FtsB